MILRPLEPPAANHQGFLPAWSIVERLQRQGAEGCWMITQPSHAALAGEFAAKMAAGRGPRIDADLVRAIALHDAGWGIPDAQAIMQSRSVRQSCPKSFVECSVSEFLEAWEKSIDVAASTGPAGGYIVSRHFCRLAGHRVNHGVDKNSEGDQLACFMTSESHRQKQLAGRQARSTAELESLTDVLQFCDLLSLYVCSGATDDAEFPEYFGTKARLTVANDTYKLDPAIIEPGSRFAVAALRHPATKGTSGRALAVCFE
ncbi:MAG TPA: DUF3891 family protein [Candidatus Angelobacter sp.]|nr:DUF3891 family protein [Candidatus Angelobacter sp.]